MAGPNYMTGPVSPAIQLNPNVGLPQQGTRGRPSDQRFRSFAERYAIARAHTFTEDDSKLAEEHWRCIMNAKQLYNMIKESGRWINPEDDV